MIMILTIMMIMWIIIKRHLVGFCSVLCCEHVTTDCYCCGGCNSGGWTAKRFYFPQVEVTMTIIHLDNDISAICPFAWFCTVIIEYFYQISSPEILIFCPARPGPRNVPSKEPPGNFWLAEVGSSSETYTSTFLVRSAQQSIRLKISTLWMAIVLPKSSASQGWWSFQSPLSEWHIGHRPVSPSMQLEAPWSSL